ncbi:hypothetical protein VTN49DRAFT_532 [Thermomyces lanuginosus]|uniref:uncharacterized protein n=1 Tax=Thermomyces lanuginosus TaxID=5541 RepID=UPI003742FA4E
MTGGRQVISKKRPKRAGDSIKVSYVGLGYDYGAFLSDLIWFSTPPAFGFLSLLHKRLSSIRFVELDQVFCEGAGSRHNMSAQGYYQQQGPEYPQPAYGPQPPYQGPPPPQGYYQQPAPNYQQQPPPEAQRGDKDRGCLAACLATLCCCFLCEETCECCLECLECCF